MKKELVKADIILLLLTPDFIASEYRYSTEVQFAIKVHEAELATVIPLLIRTSNWQKTPLARLQALPRNGKSIYENATPATSGAHFETLLDIEWQKTTDEIAKIVGQLLASPDDLLKHRHGRLDLESQENSEVRQSTLPETTSIPLPERRKKKSLPLLLVASAILLMLISGGVMLALHVMSGSGNVGHGSTSNRGSSEITSPSTGLTTIPTIGVTPTATDQPTLTPSTLSPTKPEATPFPVRLSCNCSDRVVVTVTKVAIQPQQGRMLWFMTFFNNSQRSAYAVFGDNNFYLQEGDQINDPSPDAQKYYASGTVIGTFSGINLQAGETQQATVTFSFVPSTTIIYTFISIMQMDCCGGEIAQFNPVLLTF